MLSRERADHSWSLAIKTSGGRCDMSRSGIDSRCGGPWPNPSQGLLAVRGDRRLTLHGACRSHANGSNVLKTIRHLALGRNAPEWAASREAVPPHRVAPKFEGGAKGVFQGPACRG